MAKVVKKRRAVAGSPRGDLVVRVIRYRGEETDRDRRDKQRAVEQPGEDERVLERDALVVEAAVGEGGEEAFGGV